MTREEVLTKEVLHQCFTYEDGRIFWKMRPLDHFPNSRIWNMFNSRWNGKEAGSLHRYRGGDRWKICLFDYDYFRSRIVWVYHDNTITKGLVVDHIDRNPLNDRIENLRLTTDSKNKANTPARNQLGIKGIYLTPSNRYKTSIRVNGKEVHLGCFKDIESAKEVYKKAAVEIYGEFACVD